MAVKLSEYAITPAAITVPAGGSIDATNTGTMAHNLSIVGHDLKTSDIPAGGKANLDLSSLPLAATSSSARSPATRTSAWSPR